MSDEQSTNGATVSPAPASAPAIAAAPVVDVTPPAPQAVVAAPPETSELQISDDIAEQIAADATTPPAATPALAIPPVEGASPTELIKSEIKDGKDDKKSKRPTQPAAQAHFGAPKASDPTRTAVIATVIIVFVLALLAVFAYMSVNK